ncbi:hypothetical protein D0Z07_4061, partial [Hyphodiscus hymeniophilus]
EHPTDHFLFAASTTSALSSYTPITSGPKYQVGVPTGSSISSSSAGTIYFSLSAPSTYQWVGLGIGKQMAGSHIFVMYADGNGNVTISARDGNQGEVEPVFDSSLASGVELLEGSGISNGVMTANVKCTTCTLLSSATSSSSPWICAWNQGNPIDSTSETFTLNQHGPTSMRQFTFDLSAASLSSDTNPFVSSASSPSGPSSISPSSPSSTSAAGSDSDSGSSTVGPSPQTIIEYEKAHGIIMGITVVLLFPLGATYVRLFGNASLHAILQLFSLVALICGFGLGIKLAKMTDYLYKSTGRTHTVFGTVIVALFLIQPFLGFFHHYKFKKTGGRSPVSYMHIWYGRILMTLAVINGGLGLKLADNTRDGKIIYGVVSGVVACLYIAFVLSKRKTKAPFGFGKEKSGSGLMEMTESPRANNSQT